MSARVTDINAKLDRDIAKLERDIDRAKAADRRARLTDAATHLRQAILLVESCLEPTGASSALADLLVQSADKLDAIVEGRR
ncbi:MAG: hypothetical protein ACRCU1_11490 [Alsobacter sp.]